MLLEVKKLVVNYGAVEAIREVTIEAKEGETVAIIGSNGAGKSTIIKSICGLVKPLSGEIVYDGKEIGPVPAHKRTERGIVCCPEGRRIFPEITVEDNLLLGSFCRRKKKGEAEETMGQVYEIFPRLRERRRQYGGTLSGGEQQMLAIGRAMMAKPRLLLLDEPSLGLAPIIIDEVFDTIGRLHEMGTTILLVEQNAFMSLNNCDRAYVLENGRLKLSGTGKELLLNDDVRKAYLGVKSEEL